MVRKRQNVVNAGTPTNSIVDLIQLKLLAKMDRDEEFARIREEEKHNKSLMLEENRRASEFTSNEAKLAAENSASLLEMRHEKEMMVLKQDAGKAEKGGISAKYDDDDKEKMGNGTMRPPFLLENLARQG